MVFFIVPDVLISLVAIFSQRRFLICLAATVLGSFTAGILMYSLTVFYPETMKTMVHAVPFVPPKMFASVQAGYLHEGLWILLKAPFSGVPYKVYALLAPKHVTLLPFIFMSIAARLARFAIVGGAFLLIGNFSTRYRSKEPDRVLRMHALGWFVFYAIYWYGVK